MTPSIDNPFSNSGYTRHTKKVLGVSEKIQAEVTEILEQSTLRKRNHLSDERRSSSTPARATSRIAPVLEFSSDLNFANAGSFQISDDSTTPPAVVRESNSTMNSSTTTSPNDSAIAALSHEEKKPVFCPLFPGLNNNLPVISLPVSNQPNLATSIQATSSTLTNRNIDNLFSFNQTPPNQASSNASAAIAPSQSKKVPTFAEDVFYPEFYPTYVGCSTKLPTLEETCKTQSFHRARAKEQQLEDEKREKKAAYEATLDDFLCRTKKAEEDFAQVAPHPLDEDKYEACARALQESDYRAWAAQSERNRLRDLETDNRRALQLTEDKEFAAFFSRSRKTPEEKGTFSTILRTLRIVGIL